MVPEFSTPNAVRFVSMPAPAIDFYAIDDPHGNVTHVFDATLIRIFARCFRARYEVLVPWDDEYGSKLPNGSWSGMLGMIERSEADLAMASIAISEERWEAIRFGFPHLLSPLTFMTDKPTPVSRTMSIMYPFPYDVWIALAICLMSVSLVFYALMRRKKEYELVALRIFGSLLEQELKIAATGLKLNLVAMSWFCSAMIVTYSYKAILLSFLSVPTLSGIRDIPGLSKAISAGSVTCFTYKGTYTPKKFFESDDDSRKALGKCLLDNEELSGHPDEYFPSFPGRKAYVGTEVFLSFYDRDFFVSEDSFYNHLFGIAVSDSFCSAEYFNGWVHRLTAAGFFLKNVRDGKFYQQLNRPRLYFSEQEVPGKIELEDVAGAFYILVSGWISALVTLSVEIVVRKYTVR